MFCIFLVCLVGFIICDVDNGLFMLNINDRDEIVLFSMDLKTFQFEENCNFGNKYTAAFKKFKDYDDLRSGTGVIFMDYNQYKVFLHDDVNNRQSGDVLKCNLETKGIAKIIHYDFSCEFLYDKGLDYAWCVSTTNSSGAAFYELDNHDVRLRQQIPYIAVPGSGSTCSFDHTWGQFWCYLFSTEDERNGRTVVEIDVDGSPSEPCHYYKFDMENTTQLYTLGRFDTDYNMAVLRYEKDEVTRKAIVQVFEDDLHEFKLTWKQTGEQKIISKASAISSNVVANCEYSDVVFIKVFDDEGIASLIRYDWKSGEDSVVDTSKLGSLKYLGQIACL